MRLRAASLCLLFAAGAAAAATIDFYPPRPNVQLKNETTTTLFAARVQSEKGRQPSQVRLMRLQANGNLAETARMWDDGTHGDSTAGDQIYTCRLDMKESEDGMLSFTVEALYADTLLPVHSRANFIRIFGGITLKEKRAMNKTVQRAGKLYARLTQEQGLIPAQRETIAWLKQQPGVVSVSPITQRDLYIQFLSGAGMILNGPPSPKNAPAN